MILLFLIIMPCITWGIIGGAFMLGVRIAERISER